MCEYIKRRYPHIYLYTSTNGLAFDEARARSLVQHRGINEVTFSLDGAIDGEELKPDDAGVNAGESSRLRRRNRGRARGRGRAPTPQQRGRDVPFRQVSLQAVQGA